MPLNRRKECPPPTVAGTTPRSGRSVWHRSNHDGIIDPAADLTVAGLAASNTTKGSLAIGGGTGSGQGTITGADVFKVLKSGAGVSGAFANAPSSARLTTTRSLGSFLISYGAGFSDGVLSQFQSIGVPTVPPRITSIALAPSSITLALTPFADGTRHAVETSRTSATIPRPVGAHRFLFFRTISP